MGKQFDYYVVLVFLSVFACFQAKAQVVADSLNALQQTDSILDSALVIQVPKKSKNFLDAPVNYNAQDSIVIDLSDDKIHLHGKAELTYQTTELRADYISIDMTDKVLFAKGKQSDSSQKYIERPDFKDGDQSFVSDSMLYSFDTEKGKVYRAKTQEGDGYLHGGQIKMADKEVLFVQDGKYTTCNLDTPHFYIRAKKLKVIKSDKIITGAANLKVDDAPTPLAIPFGFFPNQQSQTSGILLPNNYGATATQGVFLNNLGYYWAVSEYFDLENLWDIYFRGSWATRLNANYKRRYKYDGRLNLEYSVFKQGFKELQNDTAGIGFPYFSKVNNFSIKWTHTQDPKANPKYKFSATVDAGSSGNNRNNLNLNTQSFVQNTFASNVALTRLLTFTKLKTAGSLVLNASHSQNVRDSTIKIDAPNLTFNVNRFFPFKTTKNVGDKWFENITLQYDFSYKSRLDSKLDTLFFRRQTLNDFQNGLQHVIPVNHNTKVLKFLSLNNRFTYTGRAYFETYDRIYDNVQERLITDTLAGFDHFHTFRYNADLTTKIYGMYQFGANKKIKALRHIITPSVGYEYSPDYSNSRYFDFYTQINAGQVDTIQYSIFQGLFGSPTSQANSNINFSIINDFQVKIKDKSDSTGEKTKKLNVLENFRLGSSYALNADSFNLNPIQFNGFLNFSKKLRVNFRGNFDPYFYDATLNRKVNTLLISDFNTFKKIARLSDINISTNYRLQGKKTGQPTTDKGSEEELEHIQNTPQAYVDFNIPWSLALGYNFNYRMPANIKSVTHTISFNGDLNLTPNWKVAFRTTYDLEAEKMTLPEIDIFRDLHCWQMGFKAILSGTIKSFQFNLNVKSPVLQDLKINRNLQWYDQ